MTIRPPLPLALAVFVIVRGSFYEETPFRSCRGHESWHVRLGWWYA